MRIIALIDDADVIERILKHLKVWDPLPDTVSPAGPDPPWLHGETLRVLIAYVFHSSKSPGFLERGFFACDITGPACL